MRRSRYDVFRREETEETSQPSAAAEKSKAEPPFEEEGRETEEEEKEGEEEEGEEEEDEEEEEEVRGRGKRERERETAAHDQPELIMATRETNETHASCRVVGCQSIEQKKK